MLVIARDLALTENPAQVPGTPLFAWQSLVTPARVSATSSAASWPAVNLANTSTVQKWVAGDTSEQLVTVTIDEVADLDYLAVARHNFGSAQILVSVEGYGWDDEGSPAGEGWFELVEPFLLGDDRPLLVRFAKRSLSAIRLRLQTGDAPATAAVLYAGELLVMERGVDIGSKPTPIPLGRKIEISNGRSQAGDYLGQIVTKASVEASADFAYLREAWYLQNFEPFAAAAVDRPFFYVGDPDNHPEHVGYCELTGDITPVQDPATRRYAVQVPMRGILK